MADDATRTDQATTAKDATGISDLPQETVSDADAKAVKGGATTMEPLAAKVRRRLQSAS